MNLLRSSLKLVIELMQRVGPLELAFLDLIQLFFHARRVSLIEEIVKAAFDQQVVDSLAQAGRMKTSFQLLDVLTRPESSS